MALIEQAMGKRAGYSRYRNGHYDPHFCGTAGEIIEFVFKKIDPSLTTACLTNIVRDARRKFRGKTMRFGEFFPFYGGSIDPETGMPLPGPGYKLDRFELIAPIYCP